MTDRPYTDDDLIAEAIRQHTQWDPDLPAVSDQMQGKPVGGGPATWDELRDEDYDAAHRDVHALIHGAADTSAWAITLGADGLVPDAERQITINAGEQPIARVLLAFEPGVSEDSRTALITGIGDAMARHIPEAS